MQVSLRSRSAELGKILTVFVFPVLLAVLSVWLSVVFASPRGRLIAEIRGNNECVSVDPSVRAAVTIQYGGTEIGRLFLLTLRVTNRGKRDLIHDTDVLAPIEISFLSSQDVKILAVLSSSAYPKETVLDCRMSPESGRLTVEFNLLRAGGYLELSALYTADAVSDPTIEGVIRDSQLVSVDAADSGIEPASLS